jgi:tRNA threonylcarbamoyladenosine biosynthesis protein TsaE
VAEPLLDTTVVDAEAMVTLGGAVAGLLRAGDLLVLTGGLGAGKTTFTRGLGAGLGVRGAVTSPTFVLARVHPSLGEGPSLVHVDAYRLGLYGGPGAGIDLDAQLDDLDLDASLDEAVTVVEWGEGVAERLAEDRLEVRIARATGGQPDEPGDGDDLDPRRVVLVGLGARWSGVAWPGAR